jgi:hypothetical protein
MRRNGLLIGVWLIAFSSALGADDAFKGSVGGIFEAHCVRCHQGERPQGGLDLTRASRAFRGGESGLAIVPGKPDESLILDFVSGEEPLMPKQGAPLSAEQIAALRRWIIDGASWPETAVLRDRSTWWSLRPIARPKVAAGVERPAADPADAARLRTPIDAFIIERLRTNGLTMSAEADRRTLIRRVVYDLHGMPPTPDEIDAFVADTAPDAYERLVERLLASPRYGERWARHWLDVVHYGETHGYDKDKRRPNAWPYRDYVIRSLNDDKPYDRFVLEQLAGDVLFPGELEGIIATGFIVAGPWDYVGHAELREGTADKQITRMLDRDDMVTNTMSTFASITVHCARCHDHKFDPITQTDYYALQAVFAGVERADRPYAEGRLVYAAASSFTPIFTFTPPPDGKPREVRVLHRGDVKLPGEIASPGALSCVEAIPSRFQLANSDDEGQRRAALARWMVDPANPLTWRSIVNRVWSYHFGRGIVDTPNDFGRMGSLPSHSELLDWLAAEFRDGDRSLKSLHRLIVTSAVYRQQPEGREEAARVDAGNILLWRMNRRRLEAEEVRDSVLAISGTLDSRMYGPGYDLFEFKDDHSPHYHYERHNPDDPASLRRTVYRSIVRSVPDPFMDTLDCPDPSLSAPVRNTTITALQALALLNNKLMVRQAEHLADRVEKECTNPRDRIARAYRLALGREPSADEALQLTSYVQRHGLANLCRAIFNLNEFVFVD